MTDLIERHPAPMLTLDEELTPEECAAIIVEHAAQLLDEHQPGWADDIDLKRLNLSSCQDCVVGQLAERRFDAVVENVNWHVKVARDVEGVGYTPFEEYVDRIVGYNAGIPWLGFELPDADGETIRQLAYINPDHPALEITYGVLDDAWVREIQNRRKK